MPTFYCVFENQPIASEISTQPSRYKRAENNFLADEKGSHVGDPGSHLSSYTSILIDLLQQLKKYQTC